MHKVGKCSRIIDLIDAGTDKRLVALRARLIEEARVEGDARPHAVTLRHDKPGNLRAVKTQPGRNFNTHDRRVRFRGNTRGEIPTAFRLRADNLYIRSGMAISVDECIVTLVSLALARSGSDTLAVLKIQSEKPEFPELPRH